ncbi:MAG: P1 family peptidase, partial [Firmicutes bacterium]|nr:P1 family peptidase [Bacillota bacterium]
DAVIPLVVQSCIYDLEYGRSDVRPDAAMAYEACQNALKGFDDRMGNVGAGTGATVGKLYDLPQAQKAGLGIHAMQAGDLKIAAVVVLNACGDIFDPDSGQKIAGLLDKERKEFLDYEDEMIKMSEEAKASAVTNTTIGCIITNAKFDKAKMNKVASMTRSAYARCINPVGMMWDGDTIYAASTGSVECDINLVGSLAAKAMQKAIVKAVDSAETDEEEYRKYAHIE